MKLTDRQSEILDVIIREYIKSAQPVSSQLLEKKRDFGISPATIRIEMQKLADDGFIFQPHTSAGRVPADKGYRFFVDSLMQGKKRDFFEDSWLEKEINDTFRLFQNLTKKMALESHALVLSYLKEEDVFWKEGWEQVLKEPEFKEQDFILDFTSFLENIEKNIGDMNINSDVEIYIGRENPFSKEKEFSFIVSKCILPDRGEGVISIIGPKRMAYDRNIKIINSLMNFFE